MYDGGKIIAGLIIFLGLITFPVWSNMAGGDADLVLQPKIITDATDCIAPVEYMRSSHMDLLVAWRDQVVREGNRVYAAFNGKEYDMSLTNTCLDCHSNKAEFCDQCHNYVGVKPFCWDCHNEPKESD